MPRCRRRVCGLEATFSLTLRAESDPSSSSEYIELDVCRDHFLETCTFMRGLRGYLSVSRQVWDQLDGHQLQKLIEEMSSSEQDGVATPEFEPPISV